MSEWALAVSLGFMASCCLVAIIGRRVVSITVKSQLIRELFYEAIAAAELCACCFELIIVADNFGVGTYAVVLFFLTIWWSKVWDCSSACPYTYLEDVAEGNVSVRVAALKIWAQIMGGCCVYRIVQIFWWFELSPYHRGRAFEECTADLQVNVYLGAIIEGVATLLCRLASRAIGELGPNFSTIYESFIGTSLVVAAFNFSGGYFNPVLATSLKWGCRGHTNIEHIIVYWLGACVGALASVPLFKTKTVRRWLLGDHRVALDLDENSAKHKYD